MFCLKKMFFEFLFLIFAFSSSCGQNVETNQDLDYADSGGRTLGTSGGPTLLNPNNELKGFEPIYVSPELEDILDRQQYNVYHEEVHGSILMPRISFALNDGDQPIKDEDYVSLLPGVDPQFYSRKRGGKGGCGPGCVPRGQMPSSSRVDIFPDPLYSPTIEEMVPYARIKDTPDTYIVMADDPVLAVDSVSKCSKNATKDESQTEGAETEGGAEGGAEASSEGGAEGEEGATPGAEEGASSEAAEGGETTAAEGGGEASTEAASEGAEGTSTEGGESSTAAPAERRRKRRSAVFDVLFQRK